MGITTKGGDYGETSLYSGARVKKNDPRIEAVGVGDELSSFLGLAKLHSHFFTEDLNTIQTMLFSVNSVVASNGDTSLSVGDMNYLEGLSRELNAKVRLSSFVIPSENISASHLDCARSLSRRFERRLIDVADEFDIDDNCLIFANRLSDILFLMARVEGNRG